MESLIGTWKNLNLPKHLFSNLKAQNQLNLSNNNNNNSSGSNNNDNNFNAASALLAYARTSMRLANALFTAL